MPHKAPSEFEIQRALCLWMTGYPDKKTNIPTRPIPLRPEVIFFHPANGGARSGVEAKQFKESGVVRGIFDLCFLGFQRFWVLEMKAAKGSLSEDQKTMWKRYETAGASGIAVAYSLAEAHQIIAGWNLLVPGAAPPFGC